MALVGLWHYGVFIPLLRRSDLYLVVKALLLKAILQTQGGFVYRPGKTHRIYIPTRIGAAVDKARLKT